MNKLLNLFFLIVFSIFLFYWFQNIIKKKKKYLYIPYSSILDIRNEVVEDEEVVEQVQKGVKSRYYDKGHFSPSMEKGVHHFHLLLSKFI